MIAVAIGAGGAGHTLHAARLGIQAELAWTPGETEQMKKRLHRIGQERPVDYYVTVAEGTIDEDLWALVTAKKKILDAVLDGRSDTGTDDSQASVLADLTWELTRQGLGSPGPPGWAGLPGGEAARPGDPRPALPAAGPAALDWPPARPAAVTTPAPRRAGPPGPIARFVRGCCGRPGPGGLVGGRRRGLPGPRWLGGRAARAGGPGSPGGSTGPASRTSAGPGKGTGRRGPAGMPPAGRRRPASAASGSPGTWRRTWPRSAAGASAARCLGGACCREAQPGRPGASRGQGGHAAGPRLLHDAPQQRRIHGPAGRGSRPLWPPPGRRRPGCRRRP